MKLFKNKKGFAALQEAPAVAIMLVVIGVVLTMGGTFMTSIRDNYGSTTIAYSIANKSLDGIQNVANQQGNIGLIAAIVIILGVLIGGLGAYLYMKNRD